MGAVEKIITIFLIASIVFSFSTVNAAGIKGRVDSGNSMYKKDNFEGALSKYQDAQTDEPENPILHFNTGDALYKMEKYEEAIKEYEKTSYSKDIELQAKSYYNIGNSLYKSGKMPDAIQYYQKCLGLNPKDQDAKYNIEFVRKKIKEQIDKNSKDSKDGKDSKEGKESKEGKDKKDKDKKEQEKQAKEEKKEKMSKEDAERLLKAINEDEKKALDKKKEQQMRNYEWGNVQEDW